MNDKVENLILEQLRQIRAEQSDMRAEMNVRFDALDARVDDLENRLTGVTVIISSVVGTMAQFSDRIEALETAVRA